MPWRLNRCVSELSCVHQRWTEYGRLLDMAPADESDIWAYRSLMQARFATYLRGASTTISWSHCRFVPGLGIRGFLLERGVIRFLYGRPLETLLLTWGVSLMIQQGLRLWFGRGERGRELARWLSGGIPVMIGVQLPTTALLIALPRSASSVVPPALAGPSGSAYARGHPEPGMAPAWASVRGGSTRVTFALGRAWPASRAARSPRSATWAGARPEHIVDSFMVVVRVGREAGREHPRRDRHRRGSTRSSNGNGRGLRGRF